MSHVSTAPDSAAHEVLAAVLSVRDQRLHVLLWRRARDPQCGNWSLPRGFLRAQPTSEAPAESVDTSVRRQLAEKVDVRQLAHLEQLAVFSEPGRIPDARVIASAFLGLVPCTADPAVPEDTRWHPVRELPAMAFDHAAVVDRAWQRLRAKLSYTNIGYALAGEEFTISGLRELYSAALDHPISATNLQRVLSRRGLLEPTGQRAAPGSSGGRPAALFRFVGEGIRVTDPFAVFRPPQGG